MALKKDQALAGGMLFFPGLLNFLDALGAESRHFPKAIARVIQNFERLVTKLIHDAFGDRLANALK